MSVTHLSSRNADVRVSLDGVTFVRTAGSAARRGVDRVLLVPWDDIHGVTLEAARKNRTVLRLEVAGAAPTADHRTDPHACTVDRKDTAPARDLVTRIEHELATRRRWREHADPRPGPRTGSERACQGGRPGDRRCAGRHTSRTAETLPESIASPSEA